MSTPRKCERCGLTLLGWITHDDADECVMALRGKYEALRRVHKLTALARDTKAKWVERWRSRARIAEARVKELEGGDIAIARLDRLQKRVAAVERACRPSQHTSATAITAN